MDNYTMNTVSDWHLTQTPPNPQQAIAVMMGIVERFPYFKHLRAACLIKSGTAYKLLNMQAKAMACYRAVAEAQTSKTESLRPYRQLADDHLRRLKA